MKMTRTMLMFLFLYVLVLTFIYSKADQVQPPTCILVSDDETPCTRGCKPGFHSSFCNETCSENCDGACSQDSGHCLTGCKSNWFGSNCSQPCSGNCVGDVCDRKSGECIHGCKDGFYGLNCNVSCSSNCTEGRCDINGGCHCKKDVLDKFCYINCDENCIGGQCAVDKDGQLKCLQGCQEGRIGPFCNEWCPYDCEACDESCSSEIMETRTKRDSRNNCRENSSCKNGYRGQGCNISCPGCLYDRFCNLSCAGGSWGEICHLPCPENCTIAQNGRSLCGKGRGLCISGCLQGYYGYSCDKTCPTTCGGRYCYMNNGSCVDCHPEYWGPKCGNKCGNCVDLKCERDGSCSCIAGFYGPRCEVKCSDRCLGHCSINSNGSHICNGDCKPGYTGDDCLGTCPADCRESGCSRKDGNCDFPHQTEGPNIPAIVLGVVLGSLLVAVSAVLLFLWKTGRLAGKSNLASDKELEAKGDKPERSEEEKGSLKATDEVDGLVTHGKDAKVRYSVQVSEGKVTQKGGPIAEPQEYDKLVEERADSAASGT